jgi:transposase
VDAKSFPESLTHIRERLQKLSLSLKDITLVYDMGNLSKQNQALVDHAPFSYVTSLVPAHHPELMKVPVKEYRSLTHPRLGPIPVVRLTQEVWGKPRTVVLFISEQLRAGQRRGLQQHLHHRFKQLAEWKAQLEKPRSGPRTAETANKRIEKLLSGQHLKEVLKIEYDLKPRGADRLRYWVDEQAREHLETEVFGKRILITDRAGWSNEEILLAYRGQSDVEGAFRQLKDEEHRAVRPQYHWTDQKIYVHTFVCLLALILGRVIELEVQQLGYREGLTGLMELLSQVRLAMVLRPSGEKGGRPRCGWKLEESDPDALRLFRHLVPPRAPFVYT